MPYFDPAIHERTRRIFEEQGPSALALDMAMHALTAPVRGPGSTLLTCPGVYPDWGFALYQRDGEWRQAIEPWLLWESQRRGYEARGEPVPVHPDAADLLLNWRPHPLFIGLETDERFGDGQWFAVGLPREIEMALLSHSGA